MNYFEVNSKRYSVDEIMNMDETELFCLFDELRLEGYEEGYREGFNEAREECREYGVW